MEGCGRTLKFHAQAADGTIEGFARDMGVNLAEPIGALMQRNFVWAVGCMFVVLTVLTFATSWAGQCCRPMSAASPPSLR